jgi:hypothetical protein
MTSLCIFCLVLVEQKVCRPLVLLGDGNGLVVKGLDVQTQSNSSKLCDFIVSVIKFGVAC